MRAFPATKRNVRRALGSIAPGFLVHHYRAWKQEKSSEPELRLLDAFPRNGCFVDVGANVGKWSRKAAGLFEHVYAFEPNTTLAARLKATLPPNVIVHQVALSDNAGTAHLSIPVMSHKEITSRASLEPGANPGFSEIVREVSTMTLDSFDFRPIAVIKIDVEGHEGSVLDGAARTIAQERPVLVVEIEERHHPGLSAQIFERILRKDYACFFLDAGRLKQFTSETIMQLQPVGAVPSIGRRMRGYVNNFIFVPAEKQSTITKTLRNRLRAQRWLFMQPSF